MKDIWTRLWIRFLFIRRVQTAIGMFLMRWARRWLGRGLDRCWICGCAPGMGLITKQGHWCQSCQDKWLRFHRPKDGMVVDWKGLGRMV